MPFSNINNPGDPPTNTVATLSGGIRYIIPHLPTAMDKTHGGSAAGDNLENYRANSTVFMRGYKENIRFLVNNGNAWLWRRVCFTMKGARIYDFVTTTNPLYLESAPNGWTRSITNANATLVGESILEVLFQGSEGQDWNDVFTAPVDTNSVNLKHDSTRVFRGGNGESRIHMAKMWHPMNANFIYDDKENGNAVTESVFHAEGNRGMGDYYIVDFITCSNTSSASTMQFIPTGRLYWHER